MTAAALLAAVLGLEAVTAPAAESSGRAHGIIVSTHGSGHDWGGEGIATTLDDIRAVGAGWVAIHPYARIGDDGSVQFHALDPADPPEHLVRPIREAHARGLKIAIMPHLAHWGSRFSWRGAITFETEAEWRRFFREYEAWIVAVARACREADGFVIGNELDRTAAHEEEWRRIIAAVRAVTPAPLTYAANWTDYERIPFWDALDAIGIQAYFPLSAEAAPTETALDAAWRARMKELSAFAARHGRHVVFTELGYNRSLRAAEKPWEYATDGPEAEGFQELLLRVALRSIENEPAISGVFLWKWFPNPWPVGRTFQLATPRLKRAIAESWRRPARGG